MKTSNDQDDHSLLALEIAASLLKKDRMDARRLGMESLCFLTDPSRTGKETALKASRVVLFGSANNEGDDDADFLNEDLGVREAILSLVQFRRLGDFGACADDSDSPETNDVQLEEKEFNELLHNLALAVLANALDVLENEGGEKIASAELKTSEATDTFLAESHDISNRDLLDTLLKVLDQAESKPHDACLSAQCLRSLLQSSKKARRKARNLNAKQIVSTALDVGQRTHVKLQNEAEQVIQQLERMDDDNDEEEN